MEIDPIDVKSILDSKNNFKLVDVREEGEYEICKIDGSVLIPLGIIKESKSLDLNNLQKSDLIITYCHHGKRSLMAAELIKAMGYTNVKSMKGGIEEWSLKIDNNISRY